MPIYSNTFVSFISENGQYCIGRIIKISQHGVTMRPLERCRIPELGESGSVVVNFGSRYAGHRALTAWVEVGDSSDECIEFFIREIDNTSRKTLLNIIELDKEELKVA
jgi:hypothetical protein